MCHSNVYCNIIVISSGIMESGIHRQNTHLCVLSIMESLHFVCIYVFEIFVLMLHQEFLTCGFFLLVQYMR